MEKKPRILWADDEIDMLKPHIMFLEKHGYDMITVNNGLDAIETAVSSHVDLVILDEHMPGISGLRALTVIKEKLPHIPVVMITKSEEEDIMNRAIGSKIADYLIKPVHPRQILSSLKKCIDSNRLVSEMAATRYVDDFREISSMIGRCRSLSDWRELYVRLVYWRVELSAGQTADESLREMRSMLEDQIDEAERLFFRFVSNHYPSWLHDPEILMSHSILDRKVLPLLKNGEKLWLVVIDNLRLDQWNMLRPIIGASFRMEEDICCSILPTTTQYARNSIFAGLLPAQVSRLYPELWVDESDTEGKNLNEERLLRFYLRRCGIDDDLYYAIIRDSESCEKLLASFADVTSRKLKVVVINFIDMLSHERTSSRAVKELSSTEAGFRSLAESWFRHSPVGELFRRIAARGEKVVLATDHGAIKVNRPLRVAADKTASDTLRYKVGRHLNYEGKNVLEVKDPAAYGLPSPGVATSFIFAGSTDYFVYRNNFNHYSRLFDDTYQHGGVSMQEMLVPTVTLIPK
ncbi:MAG: PglZ domain-containing protein [Paramuribaculum sp.]|nr:PglZ domain-containing protein [Paramuribaculum sp.]